VLLPRSLLAGFPQGGLPASPAGLRREKPALRFLTGHPGIQDVTLDMSGRRPDIPERARLCVTTSRGGRNPAPTACRGHGSGPIPASSAGCPPARAPGGERVAVSSSNPTTHPAKRTYVLDTSFLLADPAAMTRFAEHDVVLPIVVITELEGKRHHPEL